MENIEACWGNTLKKPRHKRIWLLDVAGLVSGLGAFCCMATPTLAQVIADPSLNTTVTSNSTNYEITGGTTVGERNVFHSFSRFDVPEGGIADFLNTNAIANIFARVTGGTLSDIQGLIRARGNANLFLMNPNGIVFGQNAQLDIGGSFAATTANAIAFPNGGEFSLNSHLEPGNQLLSVNPSAFLFNQINPASIENRSRVPAGLDPSGSFDTFGLRIRDGKNLMLVGGNINIDGGGIVAFGGRVDLGGFAAPGTVGLNLDTKTPSLTFPDNVPKADVSLTNGAGIIVTTNGGGSIGISAGNIKLAGESSLDAGIAQNLGSVGTQAGDITLNATGTIAIDSGSYIQNYVDVGATGNSGNIAIQTGELKVSDGTIQALTLGNGNAGSVLIQADDFVSLANSGIRSNVKSSAVGNSAGVKIIAGSLFATNGAQIQADAEGQGNSGKVTIVARDTVTLNGRNSTTRFPSGAFSTVDTDAQGNSGGVDITTGSLFITNRAQLGSWTDGKGNAGNIQIEAKDQISLLNSIIISEVSENGGVGNGGDIKITTKSLLLKDGSALLADTENQGNAGNIEINARDAVVLEGRGPAALNPNEIVPNQISTTVEYAIGEGGNINIATGALSVKDRGFISSTTYGQGNAGNIFIDAKEQVTLSNANIISEVSDLGGVGKGGDIKITTKSLLLKNGSALLSDTENRGNAGNIEINARDAVVLEGTDPVSLDPNKELPSQISSTVESNAVGEGGNISIFTELLSVKDRGFISTSTFGQGDAGEIAVTAGQLLLENEANIAAFSFGDKDAGDIFIDVRDTLKANNSNISTTSGRSSGGAININAGDIRLFGDSDITTSVFSGTGGGGDIALTANTIIALDDSDLLSFARDGKGGNIRFSTSAFLSSPLYRPTPPTSDRATLEALDGNNRVDVNASGAVSGVITGVPDITFLQNSLTELSQNPIDTNALIANSCIVRISKQEGTFTITGSGGLPYRPGDASISSYPTGTIQSVKPNTLTPWKKGDPIIEATGVYRLGNGKLVMSRECR